MEKPMRPVIVTGGAGFIGSHLVDALLEKGEHVIIIDDFSSGDEANLTQAKQQSDRLEIHKLDICSDEAQQLIASSNAKHLYLLAAQISVAVSMKNPLEDTRINIMGLVNCLEGARKAGVEKVIFTSSGGAIYGEGTENAKIETDEQHPGSFYGLSKSVGLQYLAMFEASYGLTWTAIAPSNVYGPRQSGDGEAGVVAIFAERLLAGKPCTIFGDGTTTRDYVYVKDVVAAFMLAAEKGSGFYNAGTNIETNVNTIYQHVKQALDSSQDAEYAAPRAGDLQHIRLSFAKAKNELGWEPRMQLVEGIKLTVADIKTRV